MNQTRLLGVLVIAAVTLILVTASLYTVDERERTLVTKFGQVVRYDDTAGLHFKIPLVHNVRYFDARILTMDADPQPFLTKEKKSVVVDAFVKWRIEALVREGDALRERLGAVDEATIAARAVDEDPLARFYRTFPVTHAAVSSLGQIYRHAQARGLELERGEYRFVDDRAGRLVAYRADFPVKGSYVQIREFLAAILADLPFVALEEVAFERRRISDATIEAKVRLTLYVARDA